MQSSVNYNDMNLEKKLNVAINFQFLFLDEQLINRSCSK